MRGELGRAAGKAFLDVACTRHGGDEAYAGARHWALRLSGLGGFILRWKGLGRKFPAPESVDVWPHAKRVVFHHFPQAGHVGIYDQGRVSLGLDPGACLAGPSHRGTFVGIAKWRTWWPEDLIYFLGYALVDYLSLPFSLRAQELIEARRGRRGVELWFRFPADADTHSRVQGFYFDESGLLIRHDYRAEILGAVFNGAHLSADYQDVGGLLVATRRTVYAKPWHYPVRVRLPLPVLTARLSARPAAAPGDGSALTGPVTGRVSTAPGTSASRSSADSRS